MCGLEPVSRERMVDTVAIARRKHPGAKLSLDALCTRYGIDRSHRTLHGALLDAQLLAQVYVEPPPVAPASAGVLPEGMSGPFTPANAPFGPERNTSMSIFGKDK